MRILVISIVCFVVVYGKDISTKPIDSGILRVISRVYDQCESNEDLVQCFKVQGAKLVGRAIKVPSIHLVDGISLVKRQQIEDTHRSFNEPVLNNNDLNSMSAKSLDNILTSRLYQFINTHQLQVNIPKLFWFGQEKSTELVEEGRKKMKKYLGPFIAAVMLKAGMLKMAYHSIAIVAGKALIVGKIALIISAIIGLKKLVTTEGHEKTTYEIVKHPQVQQSHTYSSSHGEYEGHEGTGSYHRSIGEEEMVMQDKAYRGHIPRT